MIFAASDDMEGMDTKPGNVRRTQVYRILIGCVYQGLMGEGARGGCMGGGLWLATFGLL